ncbi:unnamed protein product [Somion occarium]|uniref:RED-like N-terminal domain-containing protein n=1 Tax=Somion occarium TaxID=3059160 RepID=A0ABP1E519_9APHY
MDQDSFRQLLHSAGSAASPRNVQPTATSKGKAKKADASQPAFKPRTIKKSAASNYRDRASERRHGLASDYAQVEALAEDFERRAAEAADALAKKTLEEQRKYLGGDSDHTILVKGLDFALLEQNRARVAASQNVEENESLEQAFLEAKEQAVSATNGAGKKRTREDLVRELKNKRLKGSGTESPLSADSGARESATAIDDVAKLEEAKKAGKFKPIGFKPVGQDKHKKKVKKVKVEGTRTTTMTTSTTTTKKVKRKDILSVVSSSTTSALLIADRTATSTSRPTQPTPPAVPELEPLEGDLDIFAGAGEYAGVDLGSSSESENEDRKPQKSRSPSPMAMQPKGWFDDEGDEERLGKPKSGSPLQDIQSRSREKEGSQEEGELTASRRSRSPSHPPQRSHSHHPEEGEEHEQSPEPEIPTRLQPLSSSALPSIRDMLAMDEEAQKAQKRKARKEKAGKGKGEKKLDKEGKVERDYQRLKSYTEKKAAAKS